MTEEKIVAKLKAGDIKTWRKLRQEIQQKIKKMLFKNSKILDTKELIEDIGKEVEMKVWQKLQKENDSKPIQNLENYIFILLRNEVFKQNKRISNFTEITQQIENVNSFKKKKKIVMRFF